MKKIFLLFGIAAFSSASAQQKDVFDINRHIRGFLDKKTSPEKEIKPPVINNFISIVPYQQGMKLSYVLQNGDKVFILPNSNMPCVVPDMRQFSIMPNRSNPNEYFEFRLNKQNIPGNIPNAAPPFIIIPQVK
jgi:hypothetical protein